MDGRKTRPRGPSQGQAKTGKAEPKCGHLEKNWLNKYSTTSICGNRLRLRTADLTGRSNLNQEKVKDKGRRRVRTTSAASALSLCNVSLCEGKSTAEQTEALFCRYRLGLQHPVQSAQVSPLRDSCVGGLRTGQKEKKNRKRPRTTWAEGQGGISASTLLPFTIWC